jgi:glycosyltransferase involved in cell wall biosynthesis
MFGRLPGWSYMIVASRLNLTTGRPQRAEPGFAFVAVVPYRRNDFYRVLNWVSYAVTATTLGLSQPRPDVVYASSPHLLAGLAGWFVAKVRRSRFILEVRDLWPQVLIDMGRVSQTSVIYRVLDRLERFLYHQADHIVVLAGGARAAVEGKGVPARRIAYIPNSADPEDFRPSAPREELRRRYGFTRLTAVYTGAHGPANGLDLLLEAADEARHLDIDIVLIGDGLRKIELMEQARRLGLKNVRFMEPVPKSEIPDVLHAADVGLHVLADVPLFRYGVSPNKVFDYMAAGLPILTNVGGAMAELIEGAGAGVVAGPRQLASGLQRLVLLSAAALSECGNRGLEWTRCNSRTQMIARLLGVLEPSSGSWSRSSEGSDDSAR